MELQKHVTPRGKDWDCPRCGGSALLLSVLRESHPPGVRELWTHSVENRLAGNLPCPFCGQAMVLSRVAENLPEVDVCHACQTAWFDRGETSSLTATRPASLEPAYNPARELALAEAELVAERTRMNREPADMPDRWWKLIPLMLRLPVEIETPCFSNPPFMTWGLAAMMAIIHVFTYSHLKEMLPYVGYAPGRPLTWGFLLSMFTHANPVHLVGNLYFLVLFGRHMEDRLGSLRFTLLLLLSGVAGHLCFAIMKPEMRIYSIGASGAVAGVLTAFMLAFPSHRLMFLLTPFPAVIFILVWFAIQLLGGMAMTSTGTVGVNYAAHLGGAVAGLMLGPLLARTRTAGVAS